MNSDLHKPVCLFLSVMSSLYFLQTPIPSACFLNWKHWKTTTEFIGYKYFCKRIQHYECINSYDKCITGRGDQSVRPA